MSKDDDITALLERWAAQDPGALERLIPLVMDELRSLARRHLAGERRHHTLQPTALVNELYLRLARSRVRGFDNRARFFAFAARLVREILVEYARARRTHKRGSEAVHLPIREALDVARERPIDLDLVLSVDSALRRLERIDQRQGRIVELRYFTGLSLPEIAGELDLSLSSVERGWRAAKYWLAGEMGGTTPEEPSTLWGEGPSGAKGG